MQPPSNNRVTQGQHLASKAIDYSASSDPYVYAPEDGRVDSYAYRGSGTNSAGNVLRIAGKTGMHSLCHLSASYVKPGDTVKRGQRVAKMGHTGYTIPSGVAGTHLHYYVLTPKGYVYPPNLYTKPFIKPPQGGSEVTLSESAVKTLYKRILKRTGDAGGVKNYTGKTLDFTVNDMVGSQEFKNLHTTTKTVTKEVVKNNPVHIAKIKELEAKLKAQPGGGISTEDSAAIKETNSIVKSIKSILERIFK